MKKSEIVKNIYSVYMRNKKRKNHQELKIYNNSKIYKKK